jgi:hypothetical protein
MLCFPAAVHDTAAAHTSLTPVTVRLETAHIPHTPLAVTAEDMVIRKSHAHCHDPAARKFGVNVKE